ncbi:calcium-binding protein [Cognatishimia sp. F0-27]|uniref:calcium-binding protein n=1 Tax=Cognatishimia sp. F0-27 TaxID=2816855 RepID=UPI001D0C67D3|nr:calcium-binding protein [Cognatishimia sp. F0-27]MCC1491037.1 hypothetical protein [Cognatishimia sp. F0-27]
MPTFFLSTITTTPRTLSGNENGFLTPVGAIVTDAAAVISTSGTGHTTITNMGQLLFRGTGFNAIDSTSETVSITNTTSGVISTNAASGNALQLSSTDSYVTNDGLIEARGGSALQYDGPAGGSLTLVNNGRITALDDVAIGSDSVATQVDILNSGSIIGKDAAIDLDKNIATSGGSGFSIFNSGLLAATAGPAVLLDTDFTEARLTNTGEILGGSFAIRDTGSRSVEIFNSGLLTAESTLTIDLGSGNDTVRNEGIIEGRISLGAGSDIFNGLGGSTRGEIRGGDGQDTYFLDDPNANIREFDGANSGSDTVFVRFTVRHLYENVENINLDDRTTVQAGGNALDNAIFGNEADNTLFGFEGDDWIFGQFGDDTLIGSFGEDRLDGGPGADWIHGGADNDRINGGEGADTLMGGTGSDTLNYGDSAARVAVNLGVGFYSGGDAEGDRVSDMENVIGTDFADIIVGDNTENDLYGRDGEDTLRGEDGNDTLASGSDADTLDGGAGLDTADFSRTGHDRVVVNLSTGFVSGGSGAGDTLISIERVIGTDFGDRIVGTNGGNRLTGLDGDDYLDGAGSGDILSGGEGNDTLIGGSGTDRFVFENNAGADTITDFEDGPDRLDYTGYTGVNSIADLTITVSGSGRSYFVDAGGGDIVLLSDAVTNGVVLTEADFNF